MTKATGKRTKKTVEPVTRDYTIHLAKVYHKVQFKRRAPKCIRAIRQFAEKAMKVKDVRIDTKLNKFIWTNGIRKVPTRVRVRVSRRRNEDEDAKEKMYVLVQHVAVDSFKKLQTEVVNEAA